MKLTQSFQPPPEVEAKPEALPVSDRSYGQPSAKPEPRPVSVRSVGQPAAKHEPLFRGFSIEDFLIGQDSDGDKIVATRLEFEVSSKLSSSCLSSFRRLILTQRHPPDGILSRTSFKEPVSIS